MNNVNLRKYMLVKISLLRAVLSADPLLTLSVVFPNGYPPEGLNRSTSALCALDNI